jgi:hypothetical protein
MEEHRHSWYSGQLIVGSALMLMGILFLLDNADVINIGPVWNLWPLILVAAGAGKFLNAREGKEQIEGAWLAFIGLWLYVSMNHVFGLRFGTSWPLMVIAWGVTILWKSTLKPAGGGAQKEGFCGQ